VKGYRLHTIFLLVILPHVFLSRDSIRTLVRDVRSKPELCRFKCVCSSFFVFIPFPLFPFGLFVWSGHTPRLRLHHYPHRYGTQINLALLGVPLHHDRLKREDLQPLIENILRRITCWRGELLSSAKRILTQAYLASFPTYLISFFKFPKLGLKLFESQMANFMWNDVEGNHKTHLAIWPFICMQKNFGGLGIPNVQDLNICLIG
jgi:hypothetical protein